MISSIGMDIGANPTGVTDAYGAIHLQRCHPSR